MAGKDSGSSVGVGAAIGMVLSFGFGGLFAGAAFSLVVGLVLSFTSESAAAWFIDLIPLWLFGSAGLGVVLAILLVSSENAARAKNKEQEAARERQRRLAEAQREEQSRAAAQELRVATMNSKAQEAVGVFGELPTYLKAAHRYLDTAEQEFGEGLFSPFWEAVEQAAVKLGGFNSAVKKIEELADYYAELARHSDTRVPDFPVTVDAVKAAVYGQDVSTRMQAIVRKAQANPNFATIYEQRRTTSVLIDGFRNLEDALSRMTKELANGLTSLERSVRDTNRSLQQINTPRQTSFEEDMWRSTQADNSRKMVEALQDLKRIQLRSRS